jgi:predicted DNA-binding ribbon-helix-helix protein
MKQRARKQLPRVREAVTGARASISFPETTYKSLERLAAEKKVSLAWIVREAAERYVADQTAVTNPKSER